MSHLFRLALLIALLLVLAGCDLLDPNEPSATGSIRGEVTMEGRGLDGVTVSLPDGAAVVTTSEGSFRFHGMPPGTYELSISGYPADAVFGSTSQTATVGPAGESAPVAFSVRTSNSDRAALVALYNAMDITGWAKTNWLTDAPLGEWAGVTVDDHGRVQGLSILVSGGSIPPEIGDLSSLTELWLFGGLSGLIPPEIGKLANLESLRLDAGRLAGPIPSELGNLTNLRHLRLGGELDGPVPPEIGNLVNLTELWLWGRRLSGPIPPEIGRLVNLTDLLLRGRLDSMPPEISNLASLTSLELSGLSGPIPPGIGNLSNLAELSLSGDLSDRIPSEIGNLVNLTALSLSGRLGSIPPEIGNLANLRHLSVRGLTWIPSEFGKLSNLESLVLVGAHLTGPIPSELGNLTNLWHLTIEGHPTGRIPPEIGNLVNLTALRLWGSGRDLSGPIPAEIGRLVNLTALSLQGRLGPIPPEIGNLANLTSLRLSGRDISEPIPPEIGRLANLTDLSLSGFSGLIPRELGDLVNLTELRLWGGLSGPIPPEIGRLYNLTLLLISRSNLTGPIPLEIGNLGKLQDLQFTSNDLSGPVPATISGMSNIEYLDLTNNPRMSGPLPASMTGLRSLRALLTEGTRLCAPTDAGFRTWLTKVEQSRIRACGERSAAYLVQAVQSREFPVPLVAGERAMLRVFPTAQESTTTGLPEVRARFFHHGRETYVVNIPGTTVPIQTHVDEGSLAGSANVEIPGYVVQPGLEMVIEIDPYGTLDSELLTTKRIPATGRLDVAVSAMPLFDLTLVPFVWTQTHDSSKVELAKAMEADPKNHVRLERTRTLLPIGDIKVTAHEAVLSSSNNVRDLFHEMSAIRALEGGTGYFMGILPPAYSGNASGMARQPGKLSVSSTSGSTIAHELGHNLGLGHAPCGYPGFPDGRYPYPDGSIGAWGYDFQSGGTVVPPSHKDLMSYCGPSWISDYNFTNAFAYRARSPRNAAASRLQAASTPIKSILLWGGIGTDGAPYMEPAFVVDASPLLPDRGGEYRVAGHAKDGGGELFSLSFDMPELADGDGSSSFAFVLPVDAGWQDDLASITLTGHEGSYVLDGESDLPMAILRNPQTGRIQGLLRGQPLVMQVARDATARSSRPEFEVLFSRGIPDPAAWAR